MSVRPAPLLASLAACLAITFALPGQSAAEPQPCDRLSPADMEAYLAFGAQAAEAYGARDYAGAIQGLIQAMDMCDEDPRIQYNLARAYEQAGDCNMALFWYDAVIEMNTNSVFSALIEQQREQAGRRKAQLQAQCPNSARVRVDCSDPDVRVNIGDYSARRCPYRGRMDAGTYKLKAVLEGHVPYTTQLQLVAGEENRVLVPALEPEGEVGGMQANTGTLRVSCAEGIAQVMVVGANTNETLDCPARLESLEPGFYVVSSPAVEGYEETAEVVAGETYALRMVMPGAAVERTGAFIGLRAAPSIGMASGTLYDDNNEDEIGLELDGLQPALLTFAMLLEGGYYFNDDMAVLGQFRLDVTNVSSVMGLAIFRWVFWRSGGGGVSLRLDGGLGGGRILQTVEVEDGARPLARSGPFFASLGFAPAFHLSPLIALIVAVEARVGLPDLSLPIDASAGIEVTF